MPPQWTMSYRYPLNLQWFYAPIFPWGVALRLTLSARIPRVLSLVMGTTRADSNFGALRCGRPTTKWAYHPRTQRRWALCVFNSSKAESMHPHGCFCFLFPREPPKRWSASNWCSLDAAQIGLKQTKDKTHPSIGPLNPWCMGELAIWTVWGKNCGEPAKGRKLAMGS